jgi:NADH-quinone oxidoreductase subunit G
MSEDTVNIEINGTPYKARKGEMIIRATDAQGAYVPRFCYHDKLPIAANCRMCLVEVEKAPKPLPACATPVTEGMKIFTKSPRAIAAQQATMEFLLINHPLDCPICDQGGECELQDLAMGFGADRSRYHEQKRVVADKNIGPLISTDMTRCILCTRCVRFGQDVAGIQELGTIGRAENSQIGTFIERSVDHELSGNIIDLCPVGALNSKPFRFRARAWEMTEHPLISAHDGFGSQLFGHVLRGRLMRIVARPCEALNETWISDRDRFGYEGIYSAERLATPMLRASDGSWRPADWEVALAAVSDGLTRVRSERGPTGIGMLAHPSSTLEELYLLNRLAAGLGSANIDHRLRQRDFRDQGGDEPVPGIGMALADVDRLDALLVIGSNLRQELPMLAHRVRKAAGAGAQISFLNPEHFEYLFPVAGYLAGSPAALLSHAGGILLALLDGAPPPTAVAALLAGLTPTSEQRAVAATLRRGSKRAVWLGALALRHGAYADLRVLAREIARSSGATLGELTEGANSAGAYLAGAVPHRNAGGAARQVPGLNARQMLEQPLGATLLFGCEPWADGLQPQALETLRRCGFVVAVTPFDSELLRQVAHVILPAGTFAETAGTFVNLEGRWQSFTGAAAPVGAARPGWKILRVLGNRLALDGFDYQSAEQVRDELKALGAATDGRTAAAYRAAASVTTAEALTDVPMYQLDPVLRRAASLQLTRDGQRSARHYGAG